MPRTIRTVEIDPAFEKGFSVGWHFSLPEAYRQELDIRRTEKKENGQTVLRWTQGSMYCFSEGQRIYDTPKAYLPWAEALHHIGRYIEILDATPDRYDDNGNSINGQVFFAIHTPNEQKTGTVKQGSYRLTQNDFVEFLKTGRLEENKLIQA